MYFCVCTCMCVCVQCMCAIAWCMYEQGSVRIRIQPYKSLIYIIDIYDNFRYEIYLMNVAIYFARAYNIAYMFHIKTAIKIPTMALWIARVGLIILMTRMHLYWKLYEGGFNMYAMETIKTRSLMIRVYLFFTIFVLHILLSQFLCLYLHHKPFL